MNTSRQDWLAWMLRVVSPVFDALEKGELHRRLPTRFHPVRAPFAMLEAFGRSLLGVAPWLEAAPAALDEPERALQAAWRQKALRCLDMATAPGSPDAMNFSEGGQPLVDAAFLAHALARAPKALAAALPGRARENLVNAFVASRAIVPPNNNWLLFSAMVEAGLDALGAGCDLTRVLCPLRAFQGWYVGDGAYGDGPWFHWDYYNSFVIQPMLVDLVETFAGRHPEVAAMRAGARERAGRYAAVLERMIGPDGAYPVIGRSVCYRFGAFHALAQAALQRRLPPPLSPAGVRCALGAVVQRALAAPGTFDADGWLTPGVCGEQPELAEGYIGVGSLYLCSAVFLPLGLAPQDAFWADPDAEWTGKKIWGGGHAAIDHAQD